MNSKIFQMAQRRGFSSLYNYSNAANPRVFLSVANGEHHVGDLVFELYADKQATAVENFTTLLEGNGAEGSSYIGSKLNSGMAGLGVVGGDVCEEGFGAFGVWNPEGDLSLRHHKRGMLSTVSQGVHQNGSKFMVTFNEASMLNGYQTVFGELVEGDHVLSQIESATDRHGNVSGDFTIVNGGFK